MSLPGEYRPNQRETVNAPDSGMAMDNQNIIYDVTEWRKSQALKTPTLERGAVPTIWSDTINRVQSIYARQFTNIVILAASTAIDDYTVTLIPGHGFVAGEELVMADEVNQQDPHLYLGTVLNVNVNVITLDTPIDYIYTVATSFCFRGTTEMAVDGSVTRERFVISPSVDHDWDITRLLVTMICDGTPDDSKFGNLSTLTNGMTFRLVRSYGTEYYNLANWKTNGDIANYCYDVNYEARSLPQGSHGVRARWTFASPGKMGAAIRLRGGGDVTKGAKDKLEFLVSDDLTDLISCKMLTQGHWVDLDWNGPV